VLLASRRPGEPALDEVDRDMITAIAAQAGLALEFVEVQADRERLKLVTDREEIAETLRQHAIQRLFAHGLALQGIAGRISNGTTRSAIEGQIAELDKIIRDIRATVFSFGADDNTRG
jgi:hypothetical protein